MAAAAIPATVRAHRSRRIRPIAPITPTRAEPAEQAADVARTIHIRPMADGSDRNPTMNQAHVSITAAPNTSTAHTHDGVVARAVVVRSSVACTAPTLARGRGTAPRPGPRP